MVKRTRYSTRKLLGNVHFVHAAFQTEVKVYWFEVVQVQFVQYVQKYFLRIQVHEKYRLVRNDHYVIYPIIDLL